MATWTQDIILLLFFKGMKSWIVKKYFLVKTCSIFTKNSSLSVLANVSVVRLQLILDVFWKIVWSVVAPIARLAKNETHVLKPSLYSSSLD